MSSSLKLSSDIIGDMGVGLVRYQCGRMGHIFRELPTQDHGIDAVIEIGDDDGGHTGKLIAVQIKCGESFWRGEKSGSVWFDFNSRQSDYWDHHILPVICVIVHPFDRRCIWKLVTGAERTPAGERLKISVGLDQSFDETARTLLSDIASRAHYDPKDILSKSSLIAKDNSITVHIEILLSDEIEDAAIERVLLSQVYANMWSQSRAPSDSEGSRTKQISKVIVRAFRNRAEQLKKIPRSQATFHPFEDGVEPSYWHNENLLLEINNHKDDLESITKHSEYWADPDSSAADLIFKHFYWNLTDRPSTSGADVSSCLPALKRVLEHLAALPSPPSDPPAFIQRGIEFRKALNEAQKLCEEGKFPINELQSAERAWSYAFYELKKLS